MWNPGIYMALSVTTALEKPPTIKAAVGLLDFESGRILIDGHSIQQEPMECKRSFAYLPDDPVLFPYLTGMQYLRFVADVFAVAG